MKKSSHPKRGEPLVDGVLILKKRQIVKCKKAHWFYKVIVLMQISVKNTPKEYEDVSHKKWLVTWN